MVQLITDYSTAIGAFFSPHREDLCCVCEQAFMCIQTGACVYIYGYTAFFFFFLPVWQEIDGSDCLFLQ